MSKYGAVVRSITASTTDDEIGLTAGAGKLAKIIEVHWGGEVTSSAAMCTRVARSSGQTGATTAVTAAKFNTLDQANACVFESTFATTQPTLDAGDLFAESWNAHGGVVRWLAAPGEEFVLIGAATETVISVRNSVGTSTSTYGMVTEE